MAICVGCGLRVGAGGALEVRPCESSGITCDSCGIKVKKSPDNCNGLEIRGNGLWTHRSRVVAGIDLHHMGTGSIIGNTMIGPNNTYEFPTGITSFSNTECCPITGRVSVTFGGMYVDVAVGQLIQARGLISINGGPFGAFPMQLNMLHNTSGARQAMSVGPFKDEFQIIGLPPAAVTTVQGMIRLFVVAGPPTANSDAIGVDQHGAEIQWELNVNCT